jgi:hypothetical protein
MKATMHHAFMDLSVRLVFGALLLGLLILTGIVITQPNWPTGPSVDWHP